MEALLILIGLYFVAGLVYLGWHWTLIPVEAGEVSLIITYWPLFASLAYFARRKAHPAGDIAVDPKEGTP